MLPEIARARIIVHGAVQGVGFRPFAYRLATELGLCGWALNSAQGVFIEVEGNRPQLNQFLLRLEKDKPVRAIIQSLETTFLDPAGYEGFEVRYSQDTGEKTAFIMPDIATCAACLAEILDPANRRYLYPFTTCTDCGPRFSIIEALPYDRPNTSMRRFHMCPECDREYHDPTNRRFHAEPNACPVCGPQLQCWSPSGSVLARQHWALQQAAAALRAGLSLVRQPRLDAYVAKLTAALAQQTPGPFSYSVTVYSAVTGSAAPRLAMPADALQYGATEPIAVAGGAIFLPLSMVADAPNEAVLVFQLAHAMAHISLRHATRMATRAEISRAGAPAAARMAFLEFARDLELEADGAAVRMLAGAGYDPAEVVSYLENLPPVGNEGMSTVFSAHPTTAERLKTIRAEIQKLPARRYSAGSEEFESAKRLAR